MTVAFIFSDVGVGEWFVLLAVVLVVVGPKRLPETVRKVGRFSAKLHRMADEFKRQLMAMDAEVDRAVAQTTEKAVCDAFVPGGDESSAEPSKEPPES